MFHFLLVSLFCFTGCAGQEPQGLSTRLTLAGVFRQVAVVQDNKLDEISGIVPCSDGTSFWVINDSGGEEELYRVNREGLVVQTVRVKNAKQRDWEDLAGFEVDSKFYLVIADTGNNRLSEKWLNLYVIGEPSIREDKAGSSIESDVLLRIRFAFPDGKHDCESVAVSGETVLLCSKAAAVQGNEQSVAKFYQLDIAALQKPAVARKKKDREIETTAKLIGEAPLPLATAMETSHDDSALVIRDYLTMAIYQRSKGETWAEVLVKKPASRFPGPFQKQAESVCFSKDGTQLFTIGEGLHPVLWAANLERK